MSSHQTDRKSKSPPSRKERGKGGAPAAEAQEKYIPRSAEPASNKSAIVEFRVGDVDREYARLQPMVKTWVKSPRNQPWGTRSIYFRDPDGNLVDFFVLVKARRGY